MYLPKAYKDFMNEFPEVFESFRHLGKVCREAGPMDPKTQNLVNLGIAIGAGAKGAVRSQTRKALETGATKEEITHVALLSLTTAGLPVMIAAVGWIHEVLEKEL